MGKVAFLFAGQGAQKPGMCADVAAAEPAAKAVFDMADSVRPGTSSQCFSGTKEELTATQNTQPCVFAVDLAIASALKSHGVTPDVVAGFSLGEVAALTFAGSLTNEKGFELVCHRGELMADAAAAHPGQMRAVVKLDADVVKDLAAKAAAQSGGECWPVNFNSPQQTVVAGTPEALSALDGLVKEARGRALKVAVSGAFHSPYMEDATKGLSELLSGEYALAEPSLPVYANLTGSPYPQSADERADTLAKQASNPVQWTLTLANMREAGVDTFVEVGPGHTLTGLVKRTLSGVTAISCENEEQLTALVAELA